MHASAAVALGS